MRKLANPPFFSHADTSIGALFKNVLVGKWESILNIIKGNLIKGDLDFISVNINA